MFIMTLFNSPLQFLMVCLILVFSICLHEYFHAWTAFREGDDGAAEFMTLNPLRQMGFTSLLMLAIIGIAWGSVPVDLSKLRGRRSALKVALAGPAANLLLFLIAAAVCLVSGLIVQRMQDRIPASVVSPVLYFVFQLGMYNFALMVFNLIPAPGLDGWNVLTELFPKFVRIQSETFKGAMLLLILLAFFGVPYLFLAGGWAMRMILYLGALLGGGA